MENFKKMWAKKCVVLRVMEKCDALFVSEAEIRSEIDLSGFTIPGFTLEVSNTKARGKSRLAFWYKSNVLIRERNFEEPNNEIMIISQREHQAQLWQAFIEPKTSRSRKKQIDDLGRLKH